MSKNLSENSSSEQDEQEIEDENGQLITNDVTSKFIETLAKIRFKHPEIYSSKQDIFKESNLSPQIQTSLKEKSVTTAEQARKKKMEVEQIMDQESEEDEKQPQTNTPHLEQQQLKEAFKQAAKTISLPSEQSFGQGLLKPKVRTTEEIQDENQAFHKFIQHNKKKNPDELEILEKFWGDENALDEDEKFLRKYILTKGWVEKDDEIKDEGDEDDSEFLEQMDKYEEKYNFRFEEPDGNKLKIAKPTKEILRILLESLLMKAEKNSVNLKMREQKP